MSIFDVSQALAEALPSVSASVSEQGFPRALWHKIGGPSNLATFAPGFIGPIGSTQRRRRCPMSSTEHAGEVGPVYTGFGVERVGATRNAPALESFIGHGDREQPARRPSCMGEPQLLAELRAESRLHDARIRRTFRVAGFNAALSDYLAGGACRSLVNIGFPALVSATRTSS